jgi:hypothetical protein
VPWTKTIGLVFGSQSADFTTTGQSSALAGGVPTKLTSAPASDEPVELGLLELPLELPHATKTGAMHPRTKEVAKDRMFFIDVSNRAAYFGRKAVPQTTCRLQALQARPS